ncbi:MAG: ABC transporter permease, partial [Pseudolysinimonas sp.]
MAFGAFSSATPVAAEPAVRRRSPIALFLLLPGALYLGLFFLVPFVSLILTSFQAPREFGDIGQYDYAFKWENYTSVIQTYMPHILRSFGYAAIATVLALLFSYPLAYFIGVKLRRYPLGQALALTLVIAPFFISFLLRTLAWKQILSDEGPVVSALNALTILPE